MFSHVTLGTNDLLRAAAFYDAVLAPLGLVRRPVEPDGGPAAACWTAPGAALPRFYVYEPFDGNPASVGNGGMVAFSAPTAGAVDAAYRLALQAGGRCAGPPAPRRCYGAGYYGAYLRDLDGSKIHFVRRADLEA
ncbi:MAG: VOC family protein [Pseudomonadota bacterium]